MKINSYFAAIFLTFGITYLIRALPLVLVRRKITNVTFRSFLYYVPYVTLSVMTFPAILFSTHVIASAAVALVVGCICCLLGFKLPVTTVASCLAVFLVELLPIF